MIPTRGILPMGHFFTEATPLSFFSCLWRHLKEKNVTPEASEEEFKMNFEVDGVKVEVEIFKLPGTQEKKYFVQFTRKGGDLFAYANWMKSCNTTFLVNYKDTIYVPEDQE
jgi:hypothetical protein